MALDHLAISVAAVGAQRRPDRDATRAARGFRAQRAEHRMLAWLRQVRGADRERSREQRSVADEREARVVRHVEPLVPVGDDGVRSLDALREMLGLRRRAREETE